MNLQTSFILLCLIVIGALLQCSEPVTYDHPISPYIEDASLEYYEVDGQDTLLLSFNLFDEEGDLGLDWRDQRFPYHEYSFIADADTQVVLKSTELLKFPLYAVPKYGDKTDIKVFGGVDSRPDEYSCYDYRVMWVSEDRRTLAEDLGGFNPDDYPEFNFSKDTVFISENPDYNNIKIEFYVNRNGQDEFIDWRNLYSYDGCQGLSFDGRFPEIGGAKYVANEGSPFIIKRNHKYGYRFEYYMRSAGFRTVMQSDPFKVRVQVTDRELNRSDVIATPYTTLDELLVD